MFNLRRVGSLVAATTTTTALILSGTTVAFADEKDIVDIKVANFTDFHGRLEYKPSKTTKKDAAGNAVKDDKGKDVKVETPKKGDEMGAARVAGIIDYLRAQNENLIVTNSGDNQGGSGFVSLINKNDQPTMDFLQAIGTHGSAVGNHEFDQGYSDITGRIMRETAVEHNNVTSADDTKWKNQTQLGANIFLKGTDTREVNPYNIVDVDGVKVALIGTTSNLTVTKSAPSNVAEVDIKDSAEWVNKEAKALKDAGKADVVIALIHDDAKERANKLDSDYVDFLFGGDSHVVYENADAPVPYAQAWEYGKTVIDMDFQYDKKAKKVVGKPTYNFIDASQLADLKITPNVNVEKIVTEAKKNADELGEQVVATIKSDFKRGSNPGASAGSNRGTESTANNMLAQSAVQSLSKYMGREIDFGIMNAGGVRDDLPKGEITYKDAVTVQPFGNDISFAKIKGSTLKEMLENQWQTEEKTASSGRPRLDMGLSDNVAYTYNPEAARGQRIQNITINGANLDPNKEYTFAASTFLLDGGDDFLDPSKIIERLDIGYNDTQALIDHLNADNIEVREGQKDVGVVLPAGGLKAGKNEIKLSSLSYSSEGEPQAKTVTVKVGDATATADVDNTVTDADKGYGEQGRATVTLDIPAGVKGAQTLEITTDAGTKVTMPVTVGKGKGGSVVVPGGEATGSSTNEVIAGTIIGTAIALLIAVGLGGFLVTAGGFPIASLIMAQW
ncbi:bifunctional metallophosphatase/5'-nucleotidase [Corynebacterium sp. TA-R-1]|uniref:Bifunctional metallophosphatase/5'-nucleotidase n=1 Tax=Corynebacterium stercoris TaxID=2943490 RepID=A0ABT1G2A0_9CORY|nr:bifunctional metallophosphatase/5'-nucleotidase [Corynebacterium stercoris]